MSFINFPIFEIPEIDFDSDKLSIGDNKIDLLVIVNEDDYQGKYVNNLSQLIAAIKLNEEEQVKIIMMKTGDVLPISRYHRIYGFSYLLNFGVSNKNIGLNIQTSPYKILNFESFAYLEINGLMELMEKSDLKKMLWHKLKEMFQV